MTFKEKMDVLKSKKDADLFVKSINMFVAEGKQEQANDLLNTYLNFYEMNESFLIGREADENGVIRINI